MDALDAELEKVGGVQRGYLRQAWECKGQEAPGCWAGEGSSLTERFNVAKLRVRSVRMSISVTLTPAITHAANLAPA